MKTLSALRLELDELDRQLLSLLAGRMALSEEIARCKQAAGLPVLDAAREAQVIASRTVMAAGRLSDEEVRAVMETVMALSRARQEALIGGGGDGHA